MRIQIKKLVTNPQGMGFPYRQKVSARKCILIISCDHYGHGCLYENTD